MRLYRKKYGGWPDNRGGTTVSSHELQRISREKFGDTIWSEVAREWQGETGEWHGRTQEQTLYNRSMIYLCRMCAAWSKENVKWRGPGFTA